MIILKSIISYFLLEIFLKRRLLKMLSYKNALSFRLNFEPAPGLGLGIPVMSIFLMAAGMCLLFLIMFYISNKICFISEPTPGDVVLVM